jgi:hypothetical protein
VGQDRGGPASEAPEGEPKPGSAGRRQKAGFSVFLDQVTDEQGRHVWETRLYHAESGAETTLPGVSPEQWIVWILERLSAGGLSWPGAKPGRRRAVVEVASVEILDLVVEEDPEDLDGTHAIKAQVIVQLNGLGRLERAIGAQVLRGIAHDAEGGHQASKEV